ncbi:tetratricopeptide repeat protein [Streptomyces sp. NPDC003077]|uniref:tetratricopeptide repeat protein n=1 Tax=Streptomyces sp. NPDC003077 TaxID=3154443 RepID=UPI0033AE3AE1
MASPVAKSAAQSPAQSPAPPPAAKASPPPPTVPARPNAAFRQLRGRLSPGEFAAAVRRAARDIGEQVSCDARYVGRVEAGEIRCPNYAYERVFLHMFPGLTLTDMGFAPRETVRGRGARAAARRAAALAAGGSFGAELGTGTRGGDEPPAGSGSRPGSGSTADSTPADGPGTGPECGFGTDPGRVPELGTGPGLDPMPGTDPSDTCIENGKESDVLRRAFITGGPAAALGFIALPPSVATALPHGAGVPAARTGEVLGGTCGEAEAADVEEAVRHIRLLDDRHGAEGVYQRAAQPLRAAYELLDAGVQRRTLTDRLQAGVGELAISIGWLAHDSGRFEDARAHYTEALATARIAGNPGLEAHAFCNSAFLARDAGTPREALRTAQAGQQAARHLSSPRLLSLLALREAGGWAGLGDRRACEQALVRAHQLFARGPSDADPEWMTFYGEAELEGLEAQCWSALGERGRAAEHARRAVDLQDPHFTRNIALFTAELADDLAHSGSPEEAAVAGSQVLSLLDQVQSPRIRSMLNATARLLDPHRRHSGEVTAFLDRHASVMRESA